MTKGDKMNKWDFWNVNLETLEVDGTDKELVGGQKVRITRIMTITYELDIQEVLDNGDDESISVKDLKESEEGLSYEDIPDPDIEEDLIVTVEIL